MLGQVKKKSASRLITYCNVVYGTISQEAQNSGVKTYYTNKRMCYGRFGVEVEEEAYRTCLVDEFGSVVKYTDHAHVEHDASCIFITVFILICCDILNLQLLST